MSVVTSCNNDLLPQDADPYTVSPVLLIIPQNRACDHCFPILRFHGRLKLLSRESTGKKGMVSLHRSLELNVLVRLANISGVPFHHMVVANM
jgi:hypothetical protein